MVKSFRDLKKSRDAMFNKLNQRMESENKGGRPEKDPRFWYPQVDKAGNGFAIIRFLPPAQGEDTPYVRIFSHGFKGPGGWYIENSRTSLKGTDGTMMPDPLGEYNQAEWARAEKLEGEGNKVEADRIKNQVRDRKRKVSYISNIYVEKDPANPENEGKVFLFRYGKQIYDKIADIMNPAVEGDDPIYPFDFDEGANLRMKISKNKGGFRTYENSAFDRPSPLGETDDDQENIWGSEHELLPFLGEDQFKSYADLKARLDRVLALNTKTASEPSKSDSAYEKEEEEDLPWKSEEDEPKSSEPEPENESAVDDDDDLDYYRKLAEGV